MKLTFDQIRSITTGAADVMEENGQIHFYRFTRQQDQLYRDTVKWFDPDGEASDAEFHRRSRSTAGIKLSFYTNSISLGLKAETTRGTPRTFFAFDVCVDGVCVGSMDNYSHEPLPDPYPDGEYALGHFEKTFDLGAGDKWVCIHLPWSVQVGLKELRLDDGAWFESARPEKKLLMFGDSITQGFHALHPSARYAARLAQALEMEEYNKAVGGDIFFPELARCREYFIPDLITVAYGTNDWSRIGRDEFRNRCRAFYRTLQANYPQTPIVALSPIWRKDQEESRAFGPFEGVEEDIKAITSEIEGITFLSGIDFVPRDPALYGDGRLHPNDEGFAVYFEHLYSAIKDNI